MRARLKNIPFRLVTAALCAVIATACDGIIGQRPSIALQACAIDTVEGASGEPPSAPAGSKLVLKGWAADNLAKRTGQEVVVHLVSPGGAVVSSGNRSGTVPRPDVASHFNMPEIGSAGFHAVVDTAGLAPGTYEIMIESRFENINVACRPNRKIMLR